MDKLWSLKHHSASPGPQLKTSSYAADIHNYAYSGWQYSAFYILSTHTHTALPTVTVFFVVCIILVCLVLDKIINLSLLLMFIILNIYSYLNFLFYQDYIFQIFTDYNSSVFLFIQIFYRLQFLLFFIQKFYI